MSVDMETIKIMINVATFSMSQKIKTLETTLQSKLDEQESKYKKEIDRLETQNKNLYKIIEKLNENNTQKEMMCEDKNCSELENNYQKNIQTLQHTQTIVSNLSKNIVIYKKELDALTNNIAELEKKHQKSMQHTETFVSNLSKNIVIYKKELNELTRRFQLKEINNEAINPKVRDLTNKVADSKKIMQPPQHNDIFEELGVPTRTVKMTFVNKETLICNTWGCNQWDSKISKGLAYFDNH